MRLWGCLFCILLICVFCKTKPTQENKFQVNVLSSRFFYPRNDIDSVKTLEAIQELKPKRIDWTYCENKNILNIYKKHKIPFSLTINPQVADSFGYKTPKSRMIDYKGMPYTAPWMKHLKIKNPYWECVNNPLFFEVFLKKSLKLASLGAYAIMVDDAVFNYRLVIEKKVGCFCTHCVNSFNESNFRELNSKKTNIDIVNYLKLSLRSGDFVQKKVDWYYVNKYEAFQKQSVISFLKKWQKEIRKLYPKIKFLTNNYNGNLNKIYQVFDGGIAELKSKNVNNKDLDSLYAIANSLGKIQLFTVATENKEIHYKLLEYNIKNKRESLYTWDIMIPDKNRRYYMNLV